MKILIIGEDANLQECRQKFGDEHLYTLADAHRDAAKLVEDFDLVFDFIIDDMPEQIEIYFNYNGIVLLNTTKITLTELSFHNRDKLKARIFGFNGLPTFVNRPVFEVSTMDPSERIELQRICEQLKTDFSCVDDRVGMVTARVICMIINEAYYTVQERTASREDVDMAMRLGTNYPYGPFEWSKRIGLRHVYEVLEAVYEDTHDERYKICPLLKNEYLRSV